MVQRGAIINKRKRIFRILLSALLVTGLLAGGLYLKSISDYKAKVAALTFSEIDLTEVEDGIYEGECDTGIVRARVHVTVSDHRLASIDLSEHENGKGTPAEAILEQMVRDQTTAVDAVSGATCSSKVIRKAVENALAVGVLK